MTKGIHNGLGQIQRLVLFHLASGSPLDTITLTARVYGVDPEPDAAGRWNMMEWQYTSVRRALKTLQRAGLVGIIERDKRRRVVWWTMERLTKLIQDPTCPICHVKLRDQDLIYALAGDYEDGDYVHAQCHDGNPNKAYYYENEYRKLNNMSNADKENPPAVAE
jgi:hypothetical protein